MKLVRICMEENYFTFRDEYYRQLKREPMRNPLFPFISEFFIAYLEMKLTATGSMKTLCKWYVDDICAIIRKDEVENTRNSVNRLHRNIGFTLEI